MGASNNASSQNTNAQQQIQQAMQQAMQMYQQWLTQNPFPLQNIAPPKPGPQMAPQIPGQQFGGTQYAGQNFGSGGNIKGHQFGGPSGTQNPLLMALLSARANKPKGNGNV